MRERWHENILKIRLIDGRGEAHCVRWPRAGRLRSAGIAHPYRFLYRLWSWRTWLAYMAAMMVSMAVFGAIQELVPQLFGFGLSLDLATTTTSFDSKDFVYGMLLGTGVGIIWLVFALVIASKLANRSLAPRYRDKFLEHNKCPSCLYDLGGSVQENDGLTTCPECGGVWEMPERS